MCNDFGITTKISNLKKKNQTFQKVWDRYTEQWV